jgi:hypothetical protein
MVALEVRPTSPFAAHVAVGALSAGTFLPLYLYLYLYL